MSSKAKAWCICIIAMCVAAVCVVALLGPLR
jgi:hypothetical protein